MVDHIEFKVQTPSGNKSVFDINIGDEIYDCHGNRTPVNKIIINKIKEPIYEITYTDGRNISYLEREPIYGNNRITNCKQLISDHRKIVKITGRREMMLESIPTAEVIYEDGIKTQLKPDPYIAGALLIYGDYSYDFIAMPFDKSDILNFLQMRYHLSIKYHSIYWDELFKDYQPRVLTKDSKDRIIPIEYIRASIEERWQFIRGVFDTGFNKEWTPDHLVLLHKDGDRLLAVQELLWSMGIYSSLEYISNSEYPRSKEYRLDVHYPPEHYSRFFYNINYMEHHLMKEKQLIRRDPKFHQSIISIKKIGDGFGKSLILDQPGKLYLMDNFLYRISI